MKFFLLKRITPIALMITLLFTLLCPLASAEEGIVEINEDAAPVSDMGVADGSLSLDCESAILMEATTGTVIYTQNANAALPPASVTKVMTLLLVMEAIDTGAIKLTDTVTASATAASETTCRSWSAETPSRRHYRWRTG